MRNLKEVFGMILLASLVSFAYSQEPSGSNSGQNSREKILTPDQNQQSDQTISAADRDQQLPENKQSGNQEVRKVKSSKPDMTKAKTRTARPPVISRPSGSKMPKGTGRPGGTVKPPVIKHPGKR